MSRSSMAAKGRGRWPMRLRRVPAVPGLQNDRGIASRAHGAVRDSGRDRVTHRMFGPKQGSRSDFFFGLCVRYLGVHQTRSTPHGSPATAGGCSTAAPCSCWPVCCCACPTIYRKLPRPTRIRGPKRRACPSSLSAFQAIQYQRAIATGCLRRAASVWSSADPFPRFPEQDGAHPATH